MTAPHQRTEERGDDEQEREGGKRVHARVPEQDRQEDAGKTDHRADGEVDATGEDHEGHADRGDAEKGVVGDQVADDAQG